MPANLTPQYRKAEETFRQATDTPAKIEALEEMLRLIPKHKGTDHLQADLKRRLAKLREASAQATAKGGFDPFHIERHGAGQVLVMGMPNTGKSALVEALTDAKVTVAAFPFSTHAPMPGMMPFEDIQIQLVDMPPFMEEGMPPGMMGAVRSADLILVCLDIAAPDLLEQTEQTLAVFAERGLVPQGVTPVEGCETGPILLLGTKCDVPGAAENGDVLAELRSDLPSFLRCSAESAEGLTELRKVCFDCLDIVRVYSKLPGKDPDMDEPFTLSRGSTVVDFATAVHREFAETLRYARVWGSARFDGQSVPHDHVLEDRDVVELHT